MVLILYGEILRQKDVDFWLFKELASWYSLYNHCINYLNQLLEIKIYNEERIQLRFGIEIGIKNKGTFKHFLAERRQFIDLSIWEAFVFQYNNITDSLLLQQAGEFYRRL
jgi:hypothetical protein